MHVQGDVSELNGTDTV